ncbi:MAG: hypothetical protein ACOZBZ_02295 [Patescibacteria group bacterium]
MLDRTERSRQENLLEEAIQEYKTQPHTPELVTKTWERLWQVWGGGVNLNFIVPACNRPQEKLVELENLPEPRMMIYCPDKIATPEGLFLLGEIFPHMESWSLEKGARVINEVNVGGWYDIEARIEAPYTGTTEDGLRKLFASQGRTGQRLATYIIGAQFSFLITGHYFDDSRSRQSRLLGSRCWDRVLYARFHWSGRLIVFADLLPQFHDSLTGGRSEVLVG